MEGWVFIIGIGVVLTTILVLRSRAARRKASEADESDVLDDMPPEVREALNQDGPSPHYVFAHGLLRELVFDDRFWSLLSESTESEDGAAARVFAKMWSDVGGSGPQPTAHRIDDGVLVRMPPPQGMTECHYVAIFPVGAKRRYYTLEKSLGALNVLCEWTEEGTHANFGEGPSDEDGFIAAARAQLLPHKSN